VFASNFIRLFAINNPVVFLGVEVAAFLVARRLGEFDYVVGGTE
jgi:hypothetical protein